MIVEWWEDRGALWYGLFALLLVLAAVPLAIYGTYAYLGVGWFFTGLFLINTVLAMMLLGYAAPMASMGNMVAATLLWLYNGFLILLLLSATVYGGFKLLYS